MPSAKLIWKVFAPCENISLSTSIPDLYEVRTGKALLRQIGGGIYPIFFPLVIEPKSAFFSKLTPVARAAGMRGNKTIFTVELPKVFNARSTEVRSIFGLHVYGRHVCVSIELDRFEISKDTDLLTLQDLTAHPALLTVAREMIDIVSPSLVSIRQSQLLKIYPCIQIIADEYDTSLSEQDLIRVLTRHSAANQFIVSAVMAKNRLHQIDTTQTLLDRQGLVSYVPFPASAEEKKGNDRRFRSCSAMLELAAAGQRIMRDKIAPTVEELEIMRPMILGLPRVTIPNSSSAQRAWSLLLDEFNLVRTFDDLVETKRLTCVDIKNELSDSVAPMVALKQHIGALEGTTILCVAAATVELSAIHRYLSLEFGEAAQVALNGGEDYALQYVDPLSKARWFVVTLSFQGPSEAALEVRNLSHLIKPTILLMVGMCMGIPNKGLKVGTVVVPNEVTIFDHERLTANGTEYRPHGDRVDNGLYKLARILGASEKLSYRVVTDKGLATASRKIEDPGAILMEFIQKTFQDVAAYDMEGWGFYRAGAGQQCLWIKAVADSGEAPAVGPKGQEEKHDVQSVSTDNAIAFAILLVRRQIALNSN